ncbi:MAG: anti-sigma factor family protein [Phycisphaerales bacterium]
MKHGDKSSGRDQRDADFGAGRVPDELIDAILDGEVDRADSREMFERLRSDPSVAGDLNATRRAIGALKKPVAAPDFTDRVLGEVAKKRGGWLSHRDRRRVGYGRIAAAALVVLTVGGLYTVERMKPGTLEVVEQPRALAGLADSVSSQSAQIARQTQQDMVCLNESAFNMVQLFGGDPGASGTPARVVFEWPTGPDGEVDASAGLPRMIVFSDQPISAASLADHFSSITRQAGEAERNLREGRGLDRFEIASMLPQGAERLLPRVVDVRLLQSLGEFATSQWMTVSNTPDPVVRPGTSGISLHGVRAKGLDPVMITLPGFDLGDGDDASDPR